MKNKARIKFKLKHWEEITLFKVIEQEGFERGCGEIFVGSNGWKIASKYCVNLSYYNEINVGGTCYGGDYDCATQYDPNKKIYNNVLQTFKELGSCEEDFQPKLGDKVLVSDDKVNWGKRIFITSLPKEAYDTCVCIIEGSENKFLEGTKYNVTNWKYMKRLQQESSFKEISEDTFEVTFKVKG